MFDKKYVGLVSEIGAIMPMLDEIDCGEYIDGLRDRATEDENEKALYIAYLFAKADIDDEKEDVFIAPIDYIQGYALVFLEKIQRFQKYKSSFASFMMLNSGDFEKNDVLYINKNKKLTVFDMMKVCRAGLEYATSSMHKNRYMQGITSLQNILDLLKSGLMSKTFWATMSDGIEVLVEYQEAVNNAVKTNPIHAKLPLAIEFLLYDENEDE